MSSIYTKENTRNIKTPNPFIDIASTRLPTDIKKLFKLCRYYFYMDPTLRPIISKYAEYPVTRLIFEEPNNKLREVYEKLFFEDINIMGHLIESRLNKACFGNALVSVYYPFQRLLVCGGKECKEEYPIRKLGYKFRDYKFIAKCPKCRYSGEFDIRDYNLPNPKKINILNWNPEDISIEHNDISGNSTYEYAIPSKIRKKIFKGDPDYLAEVPKVFIDALKNKKKIEMKSSNLYHYRNYKLADGYGEWGMPLVLPALKPAWLLQLVKKNVEIICTEGIIPLDIIFPRGPEGMSPHQFINLPEWKEKIQSEISHWRKDKAYIPVLPVSVGWQRLLGQQSLGDSVQIMKELVRIICAAIGIPEEFIFGGVSYSGGSVALRIVENHFLFDRAEMRKLAEFIITNVCNYLGLPIPKFRFADFKMADDIQKRAQMDQMNMRKLISNETILAEYGIDAESEKNKVSKETISEANSQKELAKVQAESEGDANLIRAKNQIRINMMMRSMDPQMMMGPEGGGEGSPGEGREGQSPESSADPPSEPSGGQQEPSDQEAKSIARSIQTLGGIRKTLALQKLQVSQPLMYQKVLNILGDQANAVDMRPLPEQKPPRRNQSPV